RIRFKSSLISVIPNSAEHLNVFDEDVTTLPLHVRFKRAVYAALGLSNLCEAGWTGQFCENRMKFAILEKIRKFILSKKSIQTYCASKSLYNKLFFITKIS